MDAPESIATQRSRVDTGARGLLPFAVMQEPLLECAHLAVFAIVIVSGAGCRSTSSGAPSGPAATVQQVPGAPEAPDGSAHSVSSLPSSVRCGATECGGATPECCLVVYGDGSQDASCVEDSQMCQVDNDKGNALGVRGIRRLVCDDSDDCGAGKVCCYSQEELLGDSMCADANPLHSPCQSLELCSEGHSCRASAAICRPGVDISGISACSGAKRQVACGKETCRGDAPLCCGTDRGGFRCSTDGTCDQDGEHPFWCTHPDDCPGGQVCCMIWDGAGSPNTSVCVGRCAGRNYAVGLCERDAHCDEDASCVKDRSAPSPKLPPSMNRLGGCQMK